MATSQCQHGGSVDRQRVSEQFLNGTSAQYRLYSAIQIEIIKKNNSQKLGY